MGLFEDVGTGISGINDIARSTILGLREVEVGMHMAYDWGMDQLRSFEAYSKIEKELEKNIIRTLYVPAKTRARDRIIESFDKEVKEIGTKTKKEINFVNNQIDAEIKGEFSNAIQDTVSKENLKWDQLVASENGKS